MIPVHELIKERFNGHAALRERRPGSFQLHALLFHEDGDMVDIFLSEHLNGASQVRVSDEGMTQTLPIPDQDAYEVDWQFDIGPKPIFLYASHSRLTTLTIDVLRQTL